MKRHLPAGATGLDYALITHFHADHMAGIFDVDRALPIHTVIDRGWPDYQYPAPFTDQLMAGYRRFLAERTKTGMTVERFQAGSASQIRPLRDGAKCEIRNIIGN